MEMQEVCYTMEAALEKAIEMEAKSFDYYRNAYLRVKDRVAKDVLKELALEELDHKYRLEKAFFEESVSLHESGSATGASMNLTLMLEERPLDSNSTDQDVMIHAIHEEKRAVDFYGKMAEQCGGAPLEKMYRTLAAEEQDHLTRLEEIYEKHYLQQM